MGVPHFTPQEVRALSAKSPVLAAAFAGARPIRHAPGSVSVSVPLGTRLEIPARLRESLVARVPTVGGIVAGAGAISQTATNTAPGVKGTGSFPAVRWNNNPTGTPVRTIEQAVAIARKHGVDIPEWVIFRPVPEKFYGIDTWAQYCYFAPHIRTVSWKNFVQSNRLVSIGIDKRLLKIDEGIVGVFAHEMHELHALYKILRYGDSISTRTLAELIHPPTEHCTKRPGTSPTRKSPK